MCRIVNAPDIRIPDIRRCQLPDTEYPVPVIQPDNRILRPDTGYFSDSYYSCLQKQNYFNNSIVLTIVTAYYADTRVTISHIGTY